MNGALLRFRQPLGSACTIGALPEDRRVILAIGLERDTLRVRRPDRKPILSAERQAPHRGRSGEVVNPDHLLVPLVDAKCDVPAVRRDARSVVPPDGQLQRLRVALTIDKCEILVRRSCQWTRDVDKRTRRGEAVMRCPGVGPYSF